MAQYEVRIEQTCVGTIRICNYACTKITAGSWEDARAKALALCNKPDFQWEDYEEVDDGFLAQDPEGDPSVKLVRDMGEQPQPSHEIDGSLVIATIVQGDGNDNKWVAYCPESSDHMTFETTTVVNQVVLVDNHGDYLSTVDDCSQIVSGPDRDNLWHCSECGEEARWRQP